MTDNSALLCYFFYMRDSDINKQIAERNALRRTAALPDLGDQERQRLRLARHQRVMDATFTVERIRFDYWIRKGDGFWSKAGRWSQARQQVASELKMGRHMHHVLTEFGYRLLDDAWDQEGRRTYLSDEEPDGEFMKDLEAVLDHYGWSKTALRAFNNANTGETLEIEIGAGGHFLHHHHGWLGNGIG